MYGAVFPGKTGSLGSYLLFLSLFIFPPSTSPSFSSVGLWGSERGNAVFRVSTMAFTTIYTQKHTSTALSSETNSGLGIIILQINIIHDQTLSMRDTIKGFLTKAILASVLRARNSCISSLLAISEMVQSCWNREQTAKIVTLGKLILSSWN